MPAPNYRGRFAPSPTGPLHFGSLVAAVASFADARSCGGEWLVRIEDVDEIRRRPDAEPLILGSLQRFGMTWDGTPVRQSERRRLYAYALETLVKKGDAYRCNCSRKQVTETSTRSGPEGPIYPGTCRIDPPAIGAAAAWRVAVPDAEITVLDRVCGPITQNLRNALGDFVVKRIDGYTAYQLAVVVDDHEQGITHVVRGADLLWSTPRQVWLQTQLGYAHPAYAHVPLVYATDGSKLSKRDDAHPVDETHPVQTLSAAWRHLGQSSPSTAIKSVSEFWSWAVPRWHIERVPIDMDRLHD
ncbi:MAG: tRNA glutamyl-Q(34) synthetase GluQRS [Gammaproteobacteria bacterium]|nr:tRNA glutamyl-Q(34) synthetase GluQRS [Gammaproteobacteria bacterium]